MEKKYVSLGLTAIGIILIIWAIYSVFYNPFRDAKILASVLWIGMSLIVIAILIYRNKRLKKR